MGTVTGYTAAKMEEIVNATVIGIQVVEGRLVLEHYDGSVTDAGMIAAGVTFAIVVDHDADAAKARPSGAIFVIWRGTVVPTNMAVGDIWVDLS